MAAIHDEDDDIQGQPVFLMRPAENVYSYFMFIGPTETKRQTRRSPRQQNEINWDVVMGYLLVCLNFFMQIVLLYLIFQEVVIANLDWQSGIMKLGAKGNPMSLIGEAETCNDGGSLCIRDGEDYSCAPPSIQLIGRWDQLDTNKDGVWTRDEVEQAREALKCKYYVDPVEVFDVLISMLQARESLIWLHPDVSGGKMIHRPYFTYIMSDVIMCGYRSVDMCANLIQRGFFHAPLQNGTSERVGTSIESALRYCTGLLADGGTCERELPSTYSVWRVTSRGECGEPQYSQFQYTNPGSGASKSLLSVDYGARAEYELAQNFMFMLFKAIIIFAWLLRMCVECKDVVKILTFCARMPDAEAFGANAVIMEQDPSDPEDVRYRIQAITKHHRMTLIFLSVLRVLVTCVLAVVGVAYLIKTNDYADLIMNGVALVFIAEISGVLYVQVLREEVRDQTQDIKAIKVRMYGWDWLNDRPALIDILCVVVICVFVYLIMYWQKTSVVVPVHDALECACLSAGDHCVEAKSFNYDFWSAYWLRTLPDALEAINRLKVGAPAVALLEYALAGTSNLNLASNLDMARKEIASITKREGDLLSALTKRVAFLESEVPQGSTLSKSTDLDAVRVERRSLHRSRAQALVRDRLSEGSASRRAQ